MPRVMRKVDEISVPNDPHCPACKALLRYCPGHEFSINGKFQLLYPAHIEALSGSRFRAIHAPGQGSWGHFMGDPAARWSPDGQRMFLIEEFSYVDPKFNQWTAPKGAVLDGASIPRAFWTVVGSPYRGKYRYASIVHDYYCNARSRSWEAVHFMFYQACMAAGTGHTHAKLLYYAVRHFGPRWGVNISKSRGVTNLDFRHILAIEAYVRDTNPTIQEINALDSPMLGFSRSYGRRG